MFFSLLHFDVPNLEEIATFQPEGFCFGVANRLATTGDK
jgi:hypothetical protein